MVRVAGDSDPPVPPPTVKSSRGLPRREVSVLRRCSHLEALSADN